MLSECECRPRALEHHCLAAFVSDLRIEYPKNMTFEDPFHDNFGDDPLDPAESNILDSQVLELPDPEDHYRERLMLFLPWRNKDDDLSGGF